MSIVSVWNLHSALYTCTVYMLFSWNTTDYFFYFGEEMILITSTWATDLWLQTHVLGISVFQKSIRAKPASIWCND